MVLAKLEVGADYFIRLKMKAVLIPRNIGVFIVSVWNSGGEGVVCKTLYEWVLRQHHCAPPFCSAPGCHRAGYSMLQANKTGSLLWKSCPVPRCKLAVREGLQLHDCALMLGSFYQVLKICAPQSKDCTRLSLLQRSSGYDNCHLQLRLDMAWGNFSAPGILL